VCVCVRVCVCVHRRADSRLSACQGKEKGGKGGEREAERTAARDGERMNEGERNEGLAGERWGRDNRKEETGRKRECVYGRKGVRQDGGESEARARDNEAGSEREEERKRGCKRMTCPSCDSYAVHSSGIGASCTYNNRLC
jgi:hypothetical protein